MMRRTTSNRMPGQNPKREFSLSMLLINILTVLAVLALFVGILVFRSMWKDEEYSPFEKGHVLYTIEDHAYGRLLDSYYDYTPELKKLSGTDEEAVALAAYVDASIQEKAFRESGNTKAADRQKERKERALDHVGMYKGEVNRIINRLEE